MSFWYLFLEPIMTTRHSNVGDQLRCKIELGTFILLSLPVFHYVFPTTYNEALKHQQEFLRNIRHNQHNIPKSHAPTPFSSSN